MIFQIYFHNLLHIHGRGEGGVLAENCQRKWILFSFGGRTILHLSPNCLMRRIRTDVLQVSIGSRRGFDETIAFDISMIRLPRCT